MILTTFPESMFAFSSRGRRSSRCSPALYCQTVYYTVPGAAHYGQACGGDGVSESILAAMTKSLRWSALILWVHSVTVTRPHSVRIAG
jgi:hypothetical protein